jgi:hypothetical protein
LCNANGIMEKHYRFESQALLLIPSQNYAIFPPEHSQVLIFSNSFCLQFYSQTCCFLIPFVYLVDMRES